MNVFFKTEFNHDRDQESLAWATVNEEESMTVQDEAGEADINKMMDRFGVTGNINLTKRSPLPEDYIRIENFQDAMNLIRQAQESFNELPAEVRSKFENDPAKFEEWLQDPDNIPHGLKAGIVEKIVEAKKPPPIEVKVVPDPVPVP